MAARARHRSGNGGLIFLTAAVGALLLALPPSGGAAPAPAARPSAAGGAPGARSDAAHEAQARARAPHEPVQGLDLPSLKRVLLLYEGDEGSTAITAGLSSLPGVFNPATGGLDYGGLEPFDKHALRRPGHANITLTDQLAMLRFGLMLPDAPHAVRVPTHAHSNSTETKVVHADDYARAAAGSRAIVAEVRHPPVKEATPDEAARLFCGMGVDHIILTLRLSFDMQCALYVHRNETLYSRLSQFARHDESPQPADDIEMGNEQHSIDQLGVDAMVRSHLRIVKANLHLLQALVEGCAPTGTSVHVAVFETSVGIGMENAVARLAHATGLLSAPSASSVHLGKFAGRTPTPYCRTPFLFDAATRQRLRRAGDMAAQGVYEMVRVPANASTPQQLLDAASGFVHSRAARTGTPVAATSSWPLAAPPPPRPPPLVILKLARTGSTRLVDLLRATGRWAGGVFAEETDNAAKQVLCPRLQDVKPNGCADAVARETTKIMIASNATLREELCAAGEARIEELIADGAAFTINPLACKPFTCHCAWDAAFARAAARLPPDRRPVVAVHFRHNALARALSMHRARTLESKYNVSKFAAYHEHTADVEIDSKKIMLTLSKSDMQHVIGEASNYTAQCAKLMQMGVEWARGRPVLVSSYEEMAAAGGGDRLALPMAYRLLAGLSPAPQPGDADYVVDAGSHPSMFDTTSTEAAPALEAKLSNLDQFRAFVKREYPLLYPLLLRWVDERPLVV